MTLKFVKEFISPQSSRKDDFGAPFNCYDILALRCLSYGSKVYNLVLSNLACI